MSGRCRVGVGHNVAEMVCKSCVGSRADGV